jgi:hypothetical protein
VSSGGQPSITAVYNTPTSLSASIIAGATYFEFTGNLITADGSGGVSGMSLTLHYTLYQNGVQVASGGPISLTTSSSGSYSYQVSGTDSGAEYSVSFSGSGGYLSSSMTATYGNT